MESQKRKRKAKSVTDLIVEYERERLRQIMEEAFERMCLTGETGIRVFYTDEPTQLSFEFCERNRKVCDEPNEPSNDGASST